MIRPLSHAVILLAALLLMSCAASAPSPTITPLPVVEESEVLPTDPPTLTPPHTATPTGTATLVSSPTPELPDTIRHDFLFSGFSHDCRLNCWNGLRIDIQSRSEVNAVLLDKLGVSEPQRAFEATSLDFPEGIFWIGHAWVLENLEGEVGSFAIAFGIDDESDQLQHIFFNWQSVAFDPPSPQSVLSRLGTPTFVKIDTSLSTAILMIIYAQGLLLEYHIPQNVYVDDEAGTYTLELCLNKVNSSAISGAVSIGEPLSSQESLPRLYDSFHGMYFEATVPLETHYDITIDQLMERVVGEDDFCLTRTFTSG